MTMLLTPVQMKIIWIETELFFFFTRGGCVSCLRACLDVRLLPQSYQFPNLSEGADRIGGHLRGNKECPFSGVTKSGRVWRKVLESGARSVVGPLTHQRQFCLSVCQTGAQTRCLDALTSVLLQAINFPILKTRPFITNINNKTSVKIQL